MNAVLIGFTSSGKTLAGRLLASRLGLAHLDLDDCIVDCFQDETGERLTVRNIFRRLGADEFENIEHRALRQLADRDAIVLSTGGRAPMNPENQPLLQELGPVIYLRTEPAVIFTRMQKKGLPVYLRDDPTVANLERFWHQRDPVYRTLANITIDNTHLSPAQTVDRIIGMLDMKQG